MPDVLIRNLSERDKAFVQRYAAEHNLSQTAVMRQALAHGIEALRRTRPLDRDAVRRVAASLRTLSDPDFEDDAWS